MAMSFADHILAAHSSASEEPVAFCCCSHSSYWRNAHSLGATRGTACYYFGSRDWHIHEIVLLRTATCHITKQSKTTRESAVRFRARVIVNVSRQHVPAPHNAHRHISVVPCREGGAESRSRGICFLVRCILGTSEHLVVVVRVRTDPDKSKLLNDRLFLLTYDPIGPLWAIPWPAATEWFSRSSLRKRSIANGTATGGIASNEIDG